MRLRWWRTYADERDIVLADLRAHGESRGLAIVQRTELNRGTIYVTLQRMEDEGYVVSRLENDDEYDPRIEVRRRLYRLGPGPKEGHKVPLGADWALP